jgi:hypothetical protein
MTEGGDPQLVQNLEFTVPTVETLAKMYIKNPPYVDKNRDEVRATPIENIVAAKELLEHNKSPAALGEADDQSISTAGEGYVVMTVGVLDTGVSRSTCSWAPSSAHIQPRGGSTTQAAEKTLTRRRLVRRTTTETAKDQKTSSRAPAGEARKYAHVSSARLCAEQEDNGQKTAYLPCYPRQGGDQLSLCLPKAAQW